MDRFMLLKLSKYILMSLFLFGAGACVNIKGIQNPGVPKELGNNRYVVVIGLRSKSDLIADLFAFCDLQSRFYQEISDSGLELTFACLSQDERPPMKTPYKRPLVKTLY